jgi:hypothetical protein
MNECTYKLAQGNQSELEPGKKDYIEKQPGRKWQENIICSNHDILRGQSLVQQRRYSFLCCRASFVRLRLQCLVIWRKSVKLRSLGQNISCTTIPSCSRRVCGSDLAGVRSVFCTVLRPLTRCVSTRADASAQPASINIGHNHVIKKLKGSHLRRELAIQAVHDSNCIRC